MRATHRELPGSERKEFKAVPVGTHATEPGKRMAVTVVLTPDSTAKHAQAIATIATRFGLIVRSHNKPFIHSLELAGTVRDMQRAFQTSLKDHVGKDGTYRCRTGPLSVPMAFGSNIVAVLGLDTRPQSRHYHKIHERVTARDVPANGYTATAIAAAYGLPANNGLNHSVGIVEFGGAYQAAAMAWYFRRLGIARSPNVRVVGTQTSNQSGATVEVMLDAEIIAGLVPAARVVLYFYPNSTAGFYNAVNAAVTARHDAVSISWGAPEQSWTRASMTAINNLAFTAGGRGVTITAAAGDNGSSDGVSGVEVDFPASAPWIVGCGGTNLAIGAGGSYGGEQVWNSGGGATGGGKSEFFALPTHQATVGDTIYGALQTKRRLVPDVAGNADPATGWLVRVHGQSMAVGGTSAVAPMWAAIICRLNALLGRRLGRVHPALYAMPSGSLRQVLEGNNGAYQAGSPYNLCTGLGTPPANLQALFE